MADNGYIYIGCDHNSKYEGARDAESGAYLNSLTVSAVLKDSAGNTVASSTTTLSYVAASNGNYIGVIDGPTCTANLTNGATYYEEKTVSGGGYNDFRREEYEATYRGKH